MKYVSKALLKGSLEVKALHDIHVGTRVIKKDSFGYVIAVNLSSGDALRGKPAGDPSEWSIYWPSMRSSALNSDGVIPVNKEFVATTGRRAR